MEKVYPADRHSGVAIAGAAGPAMDMVKLFQLQLEHYEKVEGVAAQPRGQGQPAVGMVRSNLPAAMQGLVVVPLFAGYDLRRRQGRLFQYDVTGGRYEETQLRHDRLGQPARRHGHQARLPRGPRPARTRSTSPSRRCSTRPTRTPPPAGPTSCAASTRRWPRSPPTASSRSPDTEIAERFRLLVDRLSTPERHRHLGAAPTMPSDGGWPRMSMPFYVAPEQVMKDRADYARKGIARGRALIALALRRRHPHLRREPVEHAAQGQRDLRPHRVRRRRPLQRVRPAPHRRASATPTSRATRSAARTSTPAAWPTRTRRSSTRCSPTRSSRSRSRSSSPRSASEPGDDQLFHILYDGTVMDEERFSVLGGEADAITERMEPAATGLALGDALAVAVPALAGPERALTADDLEVAVLAAATAGGRSGASRATSSRPSSRARRARRSPKATPTTLRPVNPSRAFLPWHRQTSSSATRA